MWSVETHMNGSSRPDHENHRYEGSLVQSPSIARRGSSIFSKMLQVIDLPRGRPFGRRRSSQIVKRVKNLKITIVGCNFQGKSFDIDCDALSGTAPPSSHPRLR